MNGKQVNDDDFIRKIEKRIRAVKESEELRKEYMLINSFERDARNDGWKSGWKDGMQAGMQVGIAQGRNEGLSQGFSDGVRQTAKLMKQANCDHSFIMQMTGLSKTEIENL